MRVVFNRSTAEIHYFALQSIDRIVKQDTGQFMQWRGIHSPTLKDRTGIQEVLADMDGAQAKGDLVLQSVVCTM